MLKSYVFSLVFALTSRNKGIKAICFQQIKFSAFESEIHPSHKLTVCTRGISFSDITIAKI